MTESKDRGKERPAFLSYLLRLWWEDESEAEEGALPGESSNVPKREPVWRASLQDPHTGERRGFASLVALFGFLWHETTGERGTGSFSHETAEGGDA
jgi:hypothetical protein